MCKKYDVRNELLVQKWQIKTLKKKVPQYAIAFRIMPSLDNWVRLFTQFSETGYYHHADENHKPTRYVTSIVEICNMNRPDM